MSSDPARALQAMTEAYNFERDLLEKCKDTRLDRIVLSLDDGSVNVDPSNQAGIVQYIIFELADGDVRKHLTSFVEFELSWVLRSLHHLAVGLYQLHRKDIAHQDLKPSNALVFREDGTKIGDLGRAAYRGHQAPHENFEIAGDPSYAPPELLYGHVPADWSQRRFGCDLYLLGSMVVFFFTGLGITSIMLQYLDDSQHWLNWKGSFHEVMPYLRDAFNKSVILFLENVPDDLQTELSPMVRQLCDPDPDLRGHPLNRANRLMNPYSLERYVSSFNLLARKAELRMIGKR